MISRFRHLMHSAQHQSVRLPTIPPNMIPAAAPVPPPPPPVVAPVLGQGADYEQSTFVFDVQPDSYSGAFPQSARTKIYSTQRRWRGCDVYVDPTQSLGLGDHFVRVWVYAITGSSRVLVATGWLQPINTPRAAARVVAARALAERFEVEAQLIQFTTGLVTAAQVYISVVASDQCLEDDGEDVGVIPLTGATMLGNDTDCAIPRAGTTGTVSFPDYETELMGALVTNTTGAVLYWQALDSDTVANAAGAAPVLSVAVPANTTVFVPPDQTMGYRFGSLGCVVGASSTPAIFTAAAANSLLMRVWGR